jgi:hypothetical protein
MQVKYNIGLKYMPLQVLSFLAMGDIIKEQFIYFSTLFLKGRQDVERPSSTTEFYYNDRNC